MNYNLKPYNMKKEIADLGIPNGKVIIKIKTGSYISYNTNDSKVFYDIESSSEYDNEIFEPKNNCELFRLVNNIGLHNVLVSINIDRNLLYFLEDYNDEDSKWETKGFKLDFPISNCFDRNYSV